MKTKSKKKSKVLKLVILLAVITVPLIVQADLSPSPTTYNVPCPLNICDLETTVRRVANVLFTASIPIVSIMIIVGAFQIMTAGGKEENISKGKKTLLYAVIGLSIMFFAGAAGAIIKSIFSG